MRTIVILLLSFFSIFQGSQAADTLLIRRTVKQLLNESGLPYNYIVIRQQFYNSDGSLFREINYSDINGELTSYLFVFYKDGKISTEEFHNASDSLEYIIHYSYSKEGKIASRTKYIPLANGKLAVSEKEVSSHKNGLPVMVKSYKGKRLESSTKLSYDEKKHLTREIVVWKSSGDKMIKQEVRLHNYNDKGELIKTESTINRLDGSIDQSSISYSYDDHGRKSSVKKFNSTGDQLSEETYTYTKTGDVSQFEQYDSTGKRTLMLQYQFMKNFMEKGIQKSRYEGI